MPARSVLLVASWLFVLSGSCCCCSSDCLGIPETPAAHQEPEIEQAARDYAEANRDALFAGAQPDAGEGGGDCAPSAGDVALELGVAVLSRGHSGAGSTGRVTFNPAACMRDLVVYVVLRGGAFVAVGAIVYDRVSGAELRRLGAPPSDYDEWAGSDTDHATDELF